MSKFDDDIESLKITIAAHESRLSRMIRRRSVRYNNVVRLDLNIGTYEEDVVTYKRRLADLIEQRRVDMIESNSNVVAKMVKSPNIQGLFPGQFPVWPQSGHADDMMKERVHLLVDFLKQHKHGCSVKQMMDYFGVSSETINRVLYPAVRVYGCIYMPKKNLYVRKVTWQNNLHMTRAQIAEAAGQKHGLRWVPIEKIIDARRTNYKSVVNYLYWHVYEMRYDRATRKYTHGRVDAEAMKEAPMGNRARGVQKRPAPSGKKKPRNDRPTKNMQDKTVG